MEATEIRTPELLYSPEKPANTATIILPYTDFGQTKIRLGMHTDSTLTLLKTLSGLPDASQVKVEGRVLDKDQRALLEKHPMYRFFMSSRLVRTTGGGSFLALPLDLRVSEKNVSNWTQTPFSPESLAKQLGYKVGFYDASTLVRDWISRGLPNDLLPLFGGTNQFSIGSDTLSPQRLAIIQAILQQAFQVQEYGRQTPILSARALLNYNTFKEIKPDEDFKNKIIFTETLGLSNDKEIFKKFPYGK